MWHSQLSSPPALGTPGPLSDPLWSPKPELTHACNTQPPWLRPTELPGPLEQPCGDSPPGLHPWLCITHRSFPNTWFSKPSPLQGMGGCWQGLQHGCFPSSGLSCLCLGPALVWVYTSQTWGQSAVHDRAVRSLVGVSRATFKLRLLPLGPLSQAILQLWPCLNVSPSGLDPDLLTWLLGLTSDQVLLH